MYSLNRKTRYEIIKDLIVNSSNEEINKLVNKYFGDESIDNVEIRKKELLIYLNEMNEFWNQKNIDITDRQYVKIEKVN